MSLKEIILFLALFLILIPFNNCGEPLSEVESDTTQSQSVEDPQLEILLAPASPFIIPSSTAIRHQLVPGYAKFDVGGQCNEGQLENTHIEWWVNDPSVNSSQEVNNDSTISYSENLAQGFGYNFNKTCINGYYQVEVFLPLSTAPANCQQGCLKLGDYYLSVRIFTLQDGTPKTGSRGTDTITIRITGD